MAYACNCNHWLVLSFQERICVHLLWGQEDPASGQGWADKTGKCPNIDASSSQASSLTSHLSALPSFSPQGILLVRENERLIYESGNITCAFRFAALLLYTYELKEQTRINIRPRLWLNNSKINDRIMNIHTPFLRMNLMFRKMMKIVIQKNELVIYPLIQ